MNDNSDSSANVDASDVPYLVDVIDNLNDHDYVRTSHRLFEVEEREEGLYIGEVRKLSGEEGDG